jgi:hypothetical protein
MVYSFVFAGYAGDSGLTDICNQADTKKALLRQFKHDSASAVPAYGIGVKTGISSASCLTKFGEKVDAPHKPNKNAPKDGVTIYTDSSTSATDLAKYMRM